MGPRTLSSVLFGTLFFFVPLAQAQPVSEAEAHILSAFTTSADPGVFADNVGMGPELRSQVGPDPEVRELYQAIAALTAGRALRVQIAPPGEAARYRAIPGVSPTDPLLTLETGEQRFLFQYMPKQKRVRFVEQLGGDSLPRLAQRQRPKPAAPPTAVAAVRPRTPSSSLDAPITIDPGTPRGECVIKPIMTAMDLYNCSGPTPPAAAPAGLPPPIAAPTPPIAPQPQRPRGECVIKPVMTDEDLRNCVGVTASTPPVFPAQAAGAFVPPALPRPDCVIKPVMTDEEMRLCAAVSRSTPATPPSPVATPVAVQQPAAPAARKAPAECVIKPVMTDEDLRICAALAKSTPSSPPAPAVSYQSPAAAAPVPAPQPRRECVIKPVMSDEDLRACANVSSSTAPVPSAPAATAQTPSAPTAPKPRPQCVIKPVMTDEELKACGSRR